MRDAPLSDTYWVVDGLLLAGGYAGDYEKKIARQRVRAFLDAGIRLFVDLTEAGELPGYAEVLRDEAATRGIEVEYLRAPIPDLGVPSDGDLVDVLAAIDRALASRTPVYVHCRGGIGRTGTIVGCWLAQNGHAGDEALLRLARLRSACSSAFGRSPETDEQREIVRRWRKTPPPDA